MFIICCMFQFNNCVFPELFLYISSMCIQWQYVCTFYVSSMVHFTLLHFTCYSLDKSHLLSAVCFNLIFVIFWIVFFCFYPVAIYMCPLYVCSVLQLTCYPLACLDKSVFWAWSTEIDMYNSHLLSAVFLNLIFVISWIFSYHLYLSSGNMCPFHVSSMFPLTGFSLDFHWVSYLLYVSI